MKYVRRKGVTQIFQSLNPSSKFCGLPKEAISVVYIVSVHSLYGAWNSDNQIVI